MAPDYTMPNFGIFSAQPRIAWILLAILGYGAGSGLEENYRLWMTFVNEYKTGEAVLQQVQIQVTFLNCLDSLTSVNWNYYERQVFIL
jgi:hypothetical protein